MAVPLERMIIKLNFFMVNINTSSVSDSAKITVIKRG